jgi:predicted HTH domain antitoxin
MRHQMTIEYGDEILLGLGLSPGEFAREARFLLAAKLYDLGRISSGQAARLCSLERAEFLLALPRIGVPVSNLRVDDVQAEIDFAQRG